MSDTPRVHNSPGGVSCPKYLPGHHTHWIPVLRVYTNTPRIPIKIKHVAGQEFAVTFGGQTRRWFHHDPDALIHCIREASDNFSLVKGTTFVNFNYLREGGGVSWFNMRPEPLDECRFPDWVPYPKREPGEGATEGGANA